MLTRSPEVRMVVGKTGSKVSGYHHVPAAAVKVAGEGFWLLDLADVLHDLVVLRRALGLPLLQQRDPVLELAGVAVPRHPGVKIVKKTKMSSVSHIHTDHFPTLFFSQQMLRLLFLSLCVYL